MTLKRVFSVYPTLTFFRLEQSVDEGTYPRCGGKDEQQSKDEQYGDHWNQPPHFVLPKVGKQFAYDTQVGFHTPKERFHF
jgi:hypothetical protein